MKKIIASTLFLLFAMICHANNDKYRLILSSDPATTMTIGWNQISGTAPTVHYGTTDFGTNYTQYPMSKTEDRAVAYRGMDNRFVRLTGLTPNTNYYFVINDSQGTSSRFWFKTAPNDLSRLSFIAGGDSRNNQTPRRNANTLVSKLKPHAVFFGGDMTDGDSDAEWQDWMDDWQLTIASDGRMFPIVATRGNHDGASVIYNLFDTPTSDSYYAMTFGNNLIRTYTLNTEISVSGNQSTWVSNDLSAQTNVIWKMMQYHKPMRPHTSAKSEGNSEYDAWAQLFFDNGVRLVMDSDSHMVKTTWPVEPSSGIGSDEGFVRNDAQGTVYAGEGSWGAPLRANDDDKNWTRNSASFNQFKLIFVEESKIELRTIKVDNAASVGEASNTDPFTLPANLDVWNPSEGDVVIILPIAPLNNPEIAFVNGTSATFNDGTNLTLPINVLNNGDGISSVAFYIDDVLTETDTTAPYSFTHSYADGNYCIEAIATDVNSNTGDAKIYVNVGMFTDTDSLPVASGENDVEETETGAVYFDSGDLEMVYDSYDFVSNVPNGNQKIGLRFQNLNIPNGATIESAYIQFRSDESDSVAAELNIFAEDSGNSVPFESNAVNNLTGRARVGENGVASFVNWMPPAWASSGLTGLDQRTPEIKTLLQKIVDGPQWEQGNSCVFMIEGTGASLTNQDAKRVVDSYEGSSSNPPTLVYTYSFNSSTLNVGEILEQSSNILIHPNPFSSELTIKVSNANNDLYKIKAVRMYDIKGILVYDKAFANQTASYGISPSKISQGVYFLKVYGENNNVIGTQKVIKK